MGNKGNKGKVGYPSDVTDEEWEFVLPYLLLSREDSAHREHGCSSTANLAEMSMFFASCNKLESDEARGAQCVDLFIGKDAGANEKAHALRIFEREHAAPSGDDIEDELRVLPVFKLAATYIERRVAEHPQENVVIAKQKLSARIAHGRASIAAAAGLVKHQIAMFPVQLRHQFDSGIGGENLIGNRGHR
jgi:hypothetical protein